MHPIIFLRKSDFIMKSNVKRIVALVLAGLIILSLLPVIAMAQSAEEVIAEGTATFATRGEAFDGELIPFAPETGGELTVEITACDPGYYVDIWADGEWICEYVGSNAETVSCDVEAGAEYEIIISSYKVYNEYLGEAVAGSVSYKVTFLSNGETADPNPTDPTEPENAPGSSEENPKTITGTAWTFIAGGKTVWYLYDNYKTMIESGVYSMMLHVNSRADYTVTYRGAELPVDENGFLNYEMVDMTMQGQYLFSVTNHSDEEMFFGIEISRRPEYVNNGAELTLGSNDIVLDASAVYTLYEFCPTEAGVYRITAAAGLVGDWGTSFNPVDNTMDKTNILDWTCTAVGQSVMIGFTGADTTVATVERIGDYVKPEEIPWTQYKVTFDFNYTLPKWIQAEIDLTQGTEHTAVLGSDGFYYYNGAPMVIDLRKLEIDIQDAYINGGLRAWIMDGNGNTLSKNDYNEAMNAYFNAGLVPVTQELVTMLRNLGQANAWYREGGMVFPEAAPADESKAWMQLCSYLEVVDGDLTGDGKVNIADVSRLYAHIRGANPIDSEFTLSLGNTTGDSKVNIADVSKLYNTVKN